MDLKSSELKMEHYVVENKELREEVRRLRRSAGLSAASSPADVVEAKS